MRGIYFPLLAAALMYSCADGFTKEEHDIIGSAGEGVMRLYVVDNESDSSLLRRKALPVSQEVVRSARFNILKERMLATVNDTINPGVGIAAPQVGISRSLIAVQRFDKEGAPF